MAGDARPSRHADVGIVVDPFGRTRGAAARDDDGAGDDLGHGDGTRRRPGDGAVLQRVAARVRTPSSRPHPGRGAGAHGSGVSARPAAARLVRHLDRQLYRDVQDPCRRDCGGRRHGPLGAASAPQGRISTREMSIALYATIWVALTLFVAGEAGKVRRPVPRWAWPASLAGAVLCTVHILIAMGHHHRWSHSAAVEETAWRTASVYGLAWGGGVYVNYLFVAVWLIYLWRWWTPPSKQPAVVSGFSRTFAGVPVVVWGLRAFFFVIIFNATVVFAVSPMRAAGIVLSL